MSAAMPILVTGTMGAEEEARSAIGTLLAQILTIVRTIVAYAMEIMRRFVSWAGEHPLAATLAVVNFAIWIS
jgi:hypothetical protein